MIEIEKKYRLTSAQRDHVLQRLKEVGADDRGEEFEENTIYSGGALKRGTSVLRLRRVGGRSEEHTSELQSQSNLVCRLLLEKKKKKKKKKRSTEKIKIKVG